MRPPASPPAAPGRPRRGPRPVPIVGPVLAMVLLLGLSVAAVRPTTDPGDGAASLLATDGHRTVLQGGGRTVVVETARLTGPGLLSSGPTGLGFLPLGADEVLATPWVRVVFSEAGVAPDQWVLGVSDAGVHHHARTQGELFAVHDPPVLLLPSRARPGDTWHHRGTVRLGEVDRTTDPLPYEATLAVAAEQVDGRACLAVTVDDVVGDRRGTERTTWCPGEGVVAWASDRGEVARTAGYPADRHPGARLPARRPVPAVAPGWRFEPVDGAVLPLTMTAAFPPVALGDGRWAVANRAASDVVGVTVDGTLGRPWRAHPGGQLTALGGGDGLVVAATTRRELVAYDAAGVWLWGADLGDTTLGVPQVLGELVVAATASGRVVAFDRRTGREAWRVDLGTDREPLLLVGTDDLVAVGPDGTAVLVDAAGAVRSEGRLPEPARHAARSGTTLVAAAASGAVVHGYDLTTARPTWRAAHHDLVDQAAAAGGRVLLRSHDEGVTAFDPASGAVVWRHPMSADLLVPTGEGALLLAPDRAVLVDAAGADRAAWPLAHAPTVAALWATAGPDGVLVLDSFFGLTRGSAP